MSKVKQSLSVNINGQSKVPPGFRFHPTEEELLHYYLRKKVVYEKIDLDVIREIDLTKLEPWDIQEKCRIGSTPQNDWYFFSHKDKKYPTGTRTNRATAEGFWKATGRDKVIHSSLRRIGMRKTLVFYRGRAPQGQKSDWIMHEYRLDDNYTNVTTQEYNYGSNMCDSSQEDGWVVCRVFKKKNCHKAVESPQMSSSTPSTDSISQMQSLNKLDGSVHDHILAFINDRSRNRKQETDSLANIFTTTHDYNPMPQSMIIGSTAFDQDSSNFRAHNSRDHEHLDNWADVDRLVASQLNGQPRSSSKHMYACYDEPNENLCFSLDRDDQEPPQSSSCVARPQEAAYKSEIDLWSFAHSSSLDPFYHLWV
ncbi:hypothetical protein L1987_73609 [Smallanthus sonchifolius]|uniref:Uncharacterized protein n=1 Tax=Smallanthus sonchifolius TaxID=185202 RepID=A0ACB8ZZX4_9ASTR|nr:hypothetical protein L1987_73609 [Smallanthus sonchifolius]